jgi:hypothetical protein
MYQPKYEYELKGRSGFKYILQAAGMVFKMERIITGACGFILSALICWVFAVLSDSLMPAGKRIDDWPLGMVLIGIGLILSVLVLQVASSIISRSVRSELIGEKGFSRKAAFDFVGKNIKTLGLYTLSFLGLILVAYVLMMILLVLGRIPAMGPILYGVILFPLSIVFSILVIVSIIVLVISFFVFPAHVAEREMDLISTIKDIFLLVRYRGFYLFFCQLISSLLATPVAFLALFVAFGGLYQAFELGQTVMDKEFDKIIWSVANDLFDAIGFPAGLFLNSLLGSSSFQEALPGQYGFASAFIIVWLLLFFMVCYSFSFTYMSVSGALTYMSVIQLTQQNEEQRTRKSANSTQPIVPRGYGYLIDIGGNWYREPINIPAEGIRIGRSAPCDVVIETPQISREHAFIQVDSEDNVVLNDQNSTNGTYVNGQKVDRTFLSIGDVIQLGSDENVRFQYKQ